MTVTEMMVYEVGMLRPIRQEICNNKMIMDELSPTSKALIQAEVDRLPQAFHEDFSDKFLLLLAALRLHKFSIQHADEGKDVVAADDDLWAQMGHPSVCLYARTASDLARKLRSLERSTPEYIDCSNQIIQANLREQQRLLALLEAFYQEHIAPSFCSRLIVETIDDQGESYLKPQGASVRLLMDGKIQTVWLRQGQAELYAFARFLSDQFSKG